MRSSPPKNPLIVAARTLARTVPQGALFKTRTLGAVRIVRAPKKRKGFPTGTCFALPFGRFLWLLSFATRKRVIPLR